MWTLCGYFRSELSACASPTVRNAHPSGSTKNHRPSSVCAIRKKPVAPNLHLSVPPYLLRFDVDAIGLSVPSGGGSDHGERPCPGLGDLAIALGGASRDADCADDLALMAD